MTDFATVPVPKTVFKTKSGKEYDLKLNFTLAKKVSAWDFSSVSATPFSLMLPAKSAFQEIYTDFGLIASIAFAIIWEREKLRHPETDYTTAMQTAAELSFTDDLDGETLEAVRSALWEAFADFFPSMASDLRRVSLAQKVVLDEIEKTQEEFTRKTRELVRETLDSQFESVRQKLT